MAINKNYVYSTLLVIILLLSVAILIWGTLLLVNGKSGGSYVRVGAILTLISTMWLVVSNLKKVDEE